MTAAPTSRKRAETALAAIPGLAGARVVRRLIAGPTNVTWLVEHLDRRWVLRLDTPAAAELGLDRENEGRACTAVAAAGIAPAYRWFDAAAGICLRHFVEGRALGPVDLRDARRLERLAGTLRRLHRLPAVGRPFDPAGAVRRYAAALATPEADRVAGRALDSLKYARRLAMPPALCHNDLVAENMIETEGQGLLLIDWEYAATGDPMFDLAVVTGHHELDAGLAQVFLEAYLQRAATPEDSERLSRQCRFYGHLLQLWNLRVGGAS
jgi:thiamine kinase